MMAGNELTIALAWVALASWIVALAATGDLPQLTLPRKELHGHAIQSPCSADPTSPCSAKTPETGESKN
jgi:hypothetical protein